ncbi:MAG: sporulation protein YtfJ [Oscillospiraceae bacterium]|nr:sporulation protein YtfJ [Oscillospiraceae bacterium]
MEKKNPLSDLMRDGMDKMRQMVDTNAIVGQPICTVDGVTLIPISRVSMGFGGGGAAFGNKKDPVQEGNLGAGIGTGVKIDPVAFLIIKDGHVRVMPVALPASTTVDRIVEMVPDVVDKVNGFIQKKQADKDISPDDVV